MCNQLINKFSSFRVGIRACMVMIPLLGITWLFGLLSPLHKAFSYIFTILNSTQVSIKYYHLIVSYMRLSTLSVEITL